MIIKREDRTSHENSKQCTVYEYPFKTKNLSLSVADIRGRYPDEGYVFNTRVTEMLYVEVGLGKIVIDDKEFPLTPGAEVLIMPGQEFYYQGDLRVVIACTPAWYPEQYKEDK